MQDNSRFFKEAPPARGRGELPRRSARTAHLVPRYLGKLEFAYGFAKSSEAQGLPPYPPGCKWFQWLRLDSVVAGAAGSQEDAVGDGMKRAQK